VSQGGEVVNLKRAGATETAWACAVLAWAADDAVADLSRRLVTAKLCEDGNLMVADGMGKFILQWAVGASGV
jgi:hypothetical protein